MIALDNQPFPIVDNTDEVQAANKKKKKLREQSSSTSKVTLDTFVQRLCNYVVKEIIPY